MNWKPIQTAPPRGAFLVWIPSTRLPWPAYTDGETLRSNAHGVLNKPDEYSSRILHATHWAPITPPSDGGSEHGA